MKFLAFLPILALSLARASAIGITVNDSTVFMSIVSSYIDDAMPVIGNPTQPPTSVGDSFNLQSAVIFPEALSIGRWSLENTTNQATFAASVLLMNIEARANVGALAIGLFDFTLTQPVNYLFTGSMFGFVLLPNSSLSFGVAGFGEGSFITGDGLVAGQLETRSGSLGPGSYSFSTIASVNGFGSILFGNANLVLTASNQESTPVPDGGSTLALLGMALCVIGGICRKLNLA